MTCIVAWKRKDNTVVIAGDKMGSNSYTSNIVKEPKVFKNGDFLIGYTTSFRMGQILKHIWKQPERKVKQTTDNYMYNDVVASLTKVFKDNGFCEKDKNETGVFLIVYEGRIFVHQSDNSLLEHEGNIESCGCGEYHAKGAVGVLLQYETDIKKILDKAYSLISHYACGVSKEYDYLISKK